MRQEKTYKRLKNYLSGFSIITALFFMLCVYEPLNIYFQNKTNYFFDFYILFPECMRMLLLFIACGAVFIFVMERFARRLYLLTAAFLLWRYVSLYIQGNFMISDLPLLDGSEIKWEAYSGQMVISTIMWCAVLDVCIVMLRFLNREKFLALVKYVGIFISLVLTVTVVTAGISRGGFERKLELASTSKSVLDYSNDTNLILLVVDAVDTKAENQVLEKFR